MSTFSNAAAKLPRHFATSCICDAGPAPLSQLLLPLLHFPGGALPWHLCHPLPGETLSCRKVLSSITWEAGDAHSQPCAQGTLGCFPAVNAIPIPRHSLAEALQCWRSGRVGIPLITSQGWNSGVGSSQAPPRTIDFSMEEQFAKLYGGREAEPAAPPGFCLLCATPASCWDTRAG